MIKQSQPLDLNPHTEYLEPKIKGYVDISKKTTKEDDPNQPKVKDKEVNISINTK